MKNHIHLGAWVFLVLLVLVMLYPSPGFAQEPTPPDDEVNAIAKQLYCPVCENTPLDACRTSACEQWRGLIREKLQQGWTEEEIEGYFVEEYGDRVLAEPPKRGFNWLVYLVPPLAFLAGAYALYRGFTKWRISRSPSRPDSNEVPEDEVGIEKEYISRVEKELENR
jgi:cytochrome c-type biogenesis protein CcmH